jgi:hypothetical protein
MGGTAGVGRIPQAGLYEIEESEDVAIFPPGFRSSENFPIGHCALYLEKFAPNLFRIKLAGRRNAVCSLPGEFLSFLK